MSVVAKILEQRTYIVPGKLRITEYHFGGIPRDWAKPEAGELKLFGRSVRKAEKPADPTSEGEESKKQLPWMCYLQGGPGMHCPPPQHWSATQAVLDRGYQMLFLDQRGTGLSSPISASVLGMRGDDPVQAEYLRSFRADSIVKDFEAVRKCLTANYPESKQKWSLLGQSFGGFLSITYLSFFPEGLREAFIFAGLQPMVSQADRVYERTFKKVTERNEAYYGKFPEDVERVKQIVRFLRKNTIRLPSGGSGSLTARRFLQLGVLLGLHGGIDSVHDIVLQASNDLTLFGHLTRSILNRIDQSWPFDDNPLFAILHEPIYSQGPGSAPRWSAHRIQQKLPQFDLDTDGPVFFTGEMVYPWMFEDYAELRKMEGPAMLIAEMDDWPALYDEDQLAKNTVPVYAAVYVDDMFVEYEFAMETARKIKGCKTFITNQMYHDAVRSRMNEVTTALFNLRDDVLD